MHDLVVVGSGPAGSTCARQAALRGLDVLLLERDMHPRPKPCGGALSPRATGILDFSVESVTDVSVHGGCFYSPAGEKLVLLRKSIRGNIVDRPRFDHLLVRKAEEAGVEVIENSKVVAIEQTRKGIRILTLGDSHSSHLLVGADGVNSTVAKAVGIRHGWSPDRVALCIAADVPLDNKAIAETMAISGSSNELGIELYFGQVEYGYAWCFPKKESLSIGIGTRFSQGRNLKRAWNTFVTFLGAKKGLKLDVSSAQSFRVPIGGLKERLTGRRTMLIGDAAGLVSPITGEGIYYAMKSGILAARIATKAAKTKSPLTTRTYDLQIQREIIDELEAASSLAKVFYGSPKNIDLIWKIASEDPQMKEYILDLIVGAKSPKDLRMLMAKRLITKHPVKAIRLGF